MRKGFVLVEVLLAVATLGLMVSVLVGSVIFGQQSTYISGNNFRGSFIADEGVEALRNMRDESYANLTNGLHGLAISANQWTFSGTSDVTDIFTRSVFLAALDVHDIRRKSATESVTWQNTAQRPGRIDMEGRLTNWRRNFADWASPSQDSNLNLPGNANGNEIDMYASGSATYAIVVRNTSADPELHVVDVSNPSSMTSVGSVQLTGNILGVAVAGDVAVAVSDNDATEVQVVSLSTPTAPALVGTLNLAGNENARAVAGAGTTAFVGRANAAGAEIYAISVATPSSPSTVGTLEIGNTVNKLALAQSDTYLYVGDSLGTAEFQVVSVASPASMSIVGSYNPAGSNPGTAVAAFSTYAVLGQNNGAVSVLDVSTPSTPTLVGGPVDIGATINDLAAGVGDIYAFAGSATGGLQLQILDVSTPSSPSLLGSYGPGGEIMGVAWDFDLNRAFVVNSFDTWELAAVKPN